MIEEIPEQYVKLATTSERPVRRAPSGPTMDYSFSQVSDSSDGFGDGGGGMKPGTQVRHPTFGIGIVRRSEGRGEQEKLMVQFARAGMKKLIRRFANLEVVDEPEETTTNRTAARYYSR